MRSVAHEGAATILLTEPRDAGEVVVRCCEHAQNAGVGPEMNLADARALLAGLSLRVLPYDESLDRAALHALATWALRFSPFVAEDPPDGLLLDASGLARLFGSEENLLDEAVGAVGKLGLHVRAAIADTIGCAWGVSRYSEAHRALIASGDEREALAPLPIEALRVDEATVLALFEVGVERVEHLLALERSALPTRFDDMLLLRLDQALGRAFEVVEPNRVVPLPRTRILFHGPVKRLEAVMEITSRLCRSLAGILEKRQVGAREVTLELVRFETTPIVLELAFTRPSVDADHVAHLLKNKVERTNLGGGIERMTLTATRVAPLEHRQRCSNVVAEGEIENADRHLASLLDVLIERLGKDHVLAAEPRASHVPERAFLTGPVVARRRPVEAPIVPADRPSVLFERPEPVEVIALLPDGPPSWLRWRREEVHVVMALGPERIGAPWWSGRAPAASERRVARCLAYRDYFKVLDERGRWLWIFRGTETGHWFVHGEWV